MLKFTSADSGSEESLITSPTMYFLIPTAEKIYDIYIYIHMPVEWLPSTYTCCGTRVHNVYWPHMSTHYLTM